MSFRDIREAERVREAGNIGPGTFDGYLKPFGAECHGIDFGRKEKFKPREGPAPGKYDIDRGTAVTHERSYEAFIAGKYPGKFEVNDFVPEPYDGHLKPFGHDPRAQNLGGKYDFRPLEMGEPGKYDKDQA